MKTVVAALIEKDGKYLVAKRRTEADLGGHWEFPGGKVEAGETDAQALEREILEEFQTLVVVGKHLATAMIRDDMELKLYACQHKLGSYKLLDHDAIEWVGSLAALTSFDLAPADQDLLSQVTSLPVPKRRAEPRSKSQAAAGSEPSTYTADVLFASRKDLFEAGLHNSYQRGIGTAKDGTNTMSIVLSGGYVDDEDLGDVIIYTGEGGRDPSTGAQVADQEITGGNKRLIAAFEEGAPVYVTRGSRHLSDYSPSSGYAFAGRYFIVEHWIEPGRDGFKIIRFKLVSEQAQAKAPVVATEGGETQRVEYVSTRIVRDTKLAKKIKEKYDSTCQVCGIQITLPTGTTYAEGAHIRPLGMPHKGPDALDNLLCLCPNHHLMFDKYCYSINPETLELEGISGVLQVNASHQISREHLRYHYDNYLAHR